MIPIEAAWVVSPVSIIVCGGREFNNTLMLVNALQRIKDERGIRLLIHGAARGADQLAWEWAGAHDVDNTGDQYRIHDWVWAAFGKCAGHKRNKQMLARLLKEPEPRGVVAFPGGNGTRDMVGISEAAGVKVWRVGW